MRLFETLAQGSALWVFAALGLALGALDALLRALRALTGDPLWLRCGQGFLLAVLWLGATVWAVEYAYPHGWRAWQCLGQALGYALFRRGPGAALVAAAQRRRGERLRLRPGTESGTIDRT